MNFREIVFRARRKDTGEWVEGSFIHSKRKGTHYLIQDPDTNNTYEVYRESLHMKDHNEEWQQV